MKVLEFVKKICDSFVFKLIILVVVVINLLFFNHYLSKLWNLKPDQQNIFYLFSSSAQSIATFIAFLIAGYALVYQAMDNLENRDDTLIEIHHKIKNDYYSKIKRLSVVTGISIILSLMMIWLNGFENPIKNELLIITNLFIFLAIIMGLWFVVYIIDPNKIRKAAVKLIEEKYKDADGVVDEGEFIKLFIKLEQIAREIIYKHPILVSYPDEKVYTKEFLSFREMIQVLYRRELISKNIYTKLTEISKYRNLVVHGHVSQVDQSMYTMTENALEELNRLVESLRR